MTQEELAARVGMATPSISQLENCKQGFTSETLGALADALDCTPGDILSFDPKRSDSFWPLLQAAERLESDHRAIVYRIVSAAIIRTPDESK